MNRKPAAYSLEDGRVVTAGAPRREFASVVVTPEPEPDLVPAPIEEPAPPRRGLPWGTLFWTALSGLVLLSMGLGLINLLEDFFGRAEWLGYTGSALAVIVVIALIAIIAREALGLARLGTIDALRARAAATLLSDDRAEGRAVMTEVIAVTRALPRLARARSEVTVHLGEIIDGRDLVHIAERELMAPLDAEARRLVSAAAKRVSIVTAVSPRAAVDMFFVLATALGLIRRLALLYGGRPGTFGLVGLVRHTVSHLAMTGGMAVSDGLVQQMIGHGVAAKLSARLGEGVLNGLLTARLGLAAIEVTRPLPFSALRRPTLNDLAGNLVRPEADPVTAEPGALRAPKVAAPD
jgi:putative membrane protein